jgi:hypothetical protein
MARFGTEGRACGNMADVASIGADFERIVARFQHKGKPDPAWKSRLFNNLASGPAQKGGPYARPAVSLSGRSVQQSSLWNTSGL